MLSLGIQRGKFSAMLCFSCLSIDGFRRELLGLRPFLGQFASNSAPGPNRRPLLKKIGCWESRRSFSAERVFSCLADAIGIRKGLGFSAGGGRNSAHKMASPFRGPLWASHQRPGQKGQKTIRSQGEPTSSGIYTLVIRKFLPDPPVSAIFF